MDDPLRAWVYADGRVIWSQTGGRSGGIPEGATELTSGASSNDSRQWASSSWR